MMTKRILIVAIVLCCSASIADAENYPIKPVQIIIPFSEGSATDTIARALGKELSKLWGQPVNGVNIPGKGGIIAAGEVAQALPDGYTLFIHGAFTINPSFYSNLPYDPTKDFTSIVPLVRQPLALIVSPSSSIKSVSALIVFAKSKPGQLKFGSPGQGSAAHLAAEKFRLDAAIDMMHVSFKGGPEAVAAINASKVTFCFLPASIVKKFVDKNKLRVLAVTSRQRASVLPEVPTIAEIGLNDFEYNHWWGLWAPNAIPIHVLGKLEKDVHHAIATLELQTLFSRIGAEPMNMTSSEFTKFVISEMESMKHIAEEAGIEPE